MYILMQIKSLKNLYEIISNLDSNLLATILITSFFIIEQLITSPHKFKNKNKHFVNNLIFYTGTAILLYLVAYVQVGSLQFMNEKHFGLFYLIKVPYIIKLIIGIAILDLGTYWIHRLSHSSTFLWSLHRVHHSDTHMDSSTYFRFHPLELSFVVGNIIVAIIFGLDISIFVAYSLIELVFVSIEHTNIETPGWLDKTIGLVITTPNMHKIHHHRELEFTDSNYADIFILWDRLFGSYKYKPVKELNYGLEEFDTQKKQSFLFLLKSPFLKVEDFPKD